MLPNRTLVQQISMEKFSLTLITPYWAQVQCQLGVTEKKYCDFFVCASKNHIVNEFYSTVSIKISLLQKLDTSLRPW